MASSFPSDDRGGGGLLFASAASLPASGQGYKGRRSDARSLSPRGSRVSAGELTPERFDAVLAAMDQAYEWAENSSGNMVAQTKAELDLLAQFEAARDLILSALRQKDRAALKDCFGGDCHRIAWIRTLLESVQFSPMHCSDKRPETCLNACHSVEKVLSELGLAERVKEAHAKAALMRQNKETWPLENTEPIAEGPSATVTRENAPPPILKGFLWKRSPSALKLHRFQKRYVEICEGRILWRREINDNDPSGQVDFKRNPCVVELDEKDDGRFVVRPKGGEWVSGNFTGVESGREFHFDAGQSDLERKQWVEALQEHISFGEGKWHNPRISYKW